jgi:ATP-dependent Clp protease protease subunit
MGEPVTLTSVLKLQKKPSDTTCARHQGHTLSLNMPTPPQLPLVIFLAASLIPAAVHAEIAASDAPIASPDATPESKSEAPPKSDGKPAEIAKTEAPKKLSPEEEAAAEVRRKIDRMTLEKLRIDTELEIAALKTRKAREAENAERARIDSETALRNAKVAAENAAEDEARAESDRRITLSNTKAQFDQLDASNRTRELETESKLLKQALDNTIARSGSVVAKRKREMDAEKIVNVKQDYLKEPFVNGVLHISDRSINFPESPITDGAAKDIIDSINFLNSRDASAPIFLVINNSPGGGAMASYQIMKAIESSKAPVHVVVKGVIGGSAALLLGIAPHSHCFERTIILHTQSRGSTRGANLNSVRDSVRESEKWQERLYAPFCKKIGMSYDDFVKQQFTRNAKGEWQEFGEDAVKLKWVDSIVTRIVDKSADTLPADRAMSGMINGFRGQTPGLVERTDKDGKTYVELPPLAPGDSWMMTAPAGLYRTR